MDTAVDRLKVELAGLPEEERAELAHFLMRTLNSGTVEEIEAAWETELSRRIDQIQAGTARGKPAEELFAELRARHS